VSRRRLVDRLGFSFARWRCFDGGGSAPPANKVSSAPPILAVLLAAVSRSRGCSFLPFGVDGEAWVTGSCRRDGGGGSFMVFCFPTLSPSRRYCSGAAGRLGKFWLGAGRRGGGGMYLDALLLDLGLWKLVCGSGFLPRLRRVEVVELGSGRYGGLPRPTSHIGYGSAACGGPLLRSTKQMSCDGASPELGLLDLRRFPLRPVPRWRRLPGSAFDGEHRDLEGLQCVFLSLRGFSVKVLGQVCLWFSLEGSVCAVSCNLPC